MENDADPWLSAPGAWVSLAALLRTVERVLGIPPSEATLVLRPSLEKGLIHAELPEWSELPTERQDWFWVDPERISPKGWEYVNWKKGTLAGHPVRVRWEHVQQELATLAPNMRLDQRELPGGSRPGRAAARAGGAPPRHDWDAFWIEVALYAAKHDLDPDPAHRRDLQQHMVEWAARDLDTHLDESTIRGRLSRLFQVVAANWRATGAQLSR